MASFDANSNSASSTSGATLDWTHTCTGANLLVVGVVDENGTNIGCTYKGIKLTKIINGNVILFYLENPPDGANNIRISRTASTKSTFGVAASYIGLGAPIDSYGFNSNTLSATIAVSSTVVHSNCWLIGIGMGRRIFTCTVASDKTDRDDFDATDPIDGTSNWGIVIADSNATVSAGSNTINFTMTGTGATEILMDGIVASFPPYAARVDNALFFGNN